MSVYRCPHCRCLHESPIVSQSQFLACPNCLIPLKVTTECGMDWWIMVPPLLLKMGEDHTNLHGILHLHRIDGG